jgi:cytochrome c5
MKALGHFLFVVVLDLLVIGLIYSKAEQWNLIKESAAAKEKQQTEVLIDPKTGLQLDPKTRFVMGDGYTVVKAECAKCHPTQIVRSFKADRAGWLDAIRWMQREKGLKNFDPQTEETILKYLTTYYGK